MSRAVVVHSSDARAPYWAPVVACLRRHVVGDACAVDVITEQEREPSQHQHPLFNCYPAGTADFASRLATYLGQEQASARFVLYTQDDFVFFDDIPTQLLQGAQALMEEDEDVIFVRFLNKSEQASIKYGLVHAKTCSSPPSALASHAEHCVVSYDDNSPWLFSHQATLWRADVFRTCVGRGGETAFENEVFGTRRLQKLVRARRRTCKMLGVCVDAYRTVVGHPGQPGELNGYGEALMPYARSVCAARARNGTRNESAGLKIDSASSLSALLHSSSCVTPALDVDSRDAVAKYDRQHQLVMRVQVAMRAQAKCIICPMCSRAFDSLAGMYSCDHACADDKAFVSKLRYGGTPT